MVFCLAACEIWIVKWWTTDQDLVQESSHAVKVNIERVRLFWNDFRSHILDTSTVRVRFASDLFCKAKVSNFGISKSINQNVLWLNVPKNDISFVQILDSNQDLNENDLGLFLAHVPVVFQECKQLTPGTVFHYQHIKFICFEVFLHFYNKWMVQWFMNNKFVSNGLLAIGVDIRSFLHKFCGIKLTVLHVSYQINTAEPSRWQWLA